VINKKRVKACRKTGPGCFACGWKVFSGLIFWLLFYQEKSNSLSGNERLKRQQVMKQLFLPLIKLLCTVWYLNQQNIKIKIFIIRYLHKIAKFYSF